MAIDRAEFRKCLGSFATGVTVITAMGPRGEPVGNTVSSFNSVSLDPPLILWSLGRHAYSLKAYLSTDHFAVNVLREGQKAMSHRFAKALGNKWEGLEYDIWESGCPILPNALAIFECKIAHTYVGGDHVIFVGEVINADHDPGGRPLLFYRGNYSSIVSEEPE
jgi:flavin reductase (DIM6/NTAB) family NADH-FMN oxidoreductase RutF